MLLSLVQLADPISFANYSQLPESCVAIELESVIFLENKALKPMSLSSGFIAQIGTCFPLKLDEWAAVFAFFLEQHDDLER